MPLIAEPLDYEAVRKAIDLSLDADSLPNETIMLSIYQDAAEDEVLRRDANALDYAPGGLLEDAGKWRRVRNAAIYFCAAFLAPAVPVIVSERSPDLQQYNREKWDPTALRAVLLGRAVGEIAAYQEPDGILPLSPTMVPCPGLRNPEPVVVGLGERIGL